MLDGDEEQELEYENEETETGKRYTSEKVAHEETDEGEKSK